MQEVSAPAKQMFSRHYGEELGLVFESDMSVSQKFIPPFSENWPVASGDIDADGWTDIVIGTDIGVFVYRNIEGKRLERLPLKIANRDVKAMNVALVDLNNDRLPDLYISLYRRGNHIIFNKDGNW